MDFRLITPKKDDFTNVKEEIGMKWTENKVIAEIAKNGNFFVTKLVNWWLQFNSLNAEIGILTQLYNTYTYHQLKLDEDRPISSLEEV